MTEINKQKFIAELGKLLAFMYEEDRAAALEMYVRMFDEATDEEALIKQLVSPTRQAVVIARAYNAKERSIALGVKSQAGGSTADNNPDQSAELPNYARVVGQIQEEVRAKQNMSAVVTQEPAQTQAEPEEAEPMEPEITPETEHECVQPADEEEQAPEQADAAAAEEAAPEEAEDTEPEETEAVEAEESEPEEGSAPEAAEEETPEPAEEAVEEAAPETETEPEPAEEASEENDDKVEEIIDRAVSAEESAVETEAEPVEYVRKLRVFPLILYIIAAIPVGLIGIAIMLIPALVFLVFATACVWFGIFLVSCAFSGMRILADILIVLGVSLVLFAAGLLFLWTFIWFIGGAMAGFVRGIIRLGDKWCHKEVAA